MDGLHYRRVDKIFKENEAEFLDEEEQEKLLQELREQNDTANLNIQRGLVLIGLIISVLFITILLQSGTPIIIPISHIYEPFESVLESPAMAATFSLLSILLSIAMLVLSSKVEMIKLSETVKKYITTKSVTPVAVVLGTISPLWTILHRRYSLVELLFWSIPLMLTLMYYLAFYMINQVYEGLDELEGSKYRYKGA